MNTDDWNPRFVAYASAHGRTPDAQLAHDHVRFPGGKFAGFMNWVSALWAEWRADTGRTAATPITDAEHVAFDAWLDEIAREHLAAQVTGAARIDGTADPSVRASIDLDVAGITSGTAVPPGVVPRAPGRSTPEQQEAPTTAWARAAGASQTTGA